MRNSYEAYAIPDTLDEDEKVDLAATLLLMEDVMHAYVDGKWHKRFLEVHDGVRSAVPFAVHHPPPGEHRG